MFEKYVLLDIQTPNTRGNSICAIAVVLVENEAIVDKKYTLINPEDSFDAVYSEITGIDGSRVQDAPNLKAYWDEIQNLITGNIIIGHNIIYDLVILSRALQRYHISTDSFRYICTLELARKYIKTSSYKLENLISLLRDEYDVHTTFNGKLVAGDVFRYIKERHEVLEDEVHVYSFMENITNKSRENLNANLHNLSGIIEGILFDGVVNKTEMLRLKKWVEDNMLYKDYIQVEKIIDTLCVILEDKIVDQYEKLKLRALVTKFTSSEIYCKTSIDMQVLQGIIDGIMCDDTISKVEITKLQNWLSDHDYLTGIFPYDKLVKIVGDVINEDKLDYWEKQTLFENFKEITDPLSAHSYLPNSFRLENKTFCLTGEFTTASRNKIAKKLKEKGAIQKCGVSAKLDYLFVGGMSSGAWKFGNFGGKIARALELQQEGAKVLIVAEEELERIIA